MPFSDSEQTARLGAFFANRDPGDPPPDPAALGAPATLMVVGGATGEDKGNTFKLLNNMAGDGAIIRAKQGKSIVYSLLPEDAQPDLGVL